MSKKFLFRLSVCVVFILVFGLVINANEEQFDESNIVLRFAAVSDLHYNQGTAKFEEALKQLYEKASGERLDVVFVAGDLTDNGTKGEIQGLKRTLDKFKFAENGTEFVFALGNHDTDFDKLPYNGELFKQVLGDYAYKGATEEEIKNGNHHIIINGYHFIAVNTKTYSGGARHSDEDLKWLKEVLDKAVESDPNKPVFLATHPVIYDTIYGSKEGSYWYSKNIDDVLKDYPQVITFGGHLHFPLQDDRNIFQRDYTSLGTASMLYNSLEGVIEGVKPVDVSGGMEPSDCHYFSQGLYLEVDKNHNVRITRMDFFNKAEIKQPWIILAPKEDNSHLTKYTLEALSQDNKPPYFEADAGVRFRRITKTNIYLEFDAAKDDDYVYYYEVHLIENETDYPAGYTHAITYSDFYRYPDTDKMKTKFTKAFSMSDFKVTFGMLDSYKEYIVKVIAVDSFGLKSEPIISEVFVIEE